MRAISHPSIIAVPLYAICLVLFGCVANGPMPTQSAIVDQTGNPQTVTYSEQAIIRNGQPEIALGDPEVSALYISYLTYAGVPAFRVLLGSPGFGRQHPDYLYITKRRIIYNPPGGDGSFDYAIADIYKKDFTETRTWPYETSGIVLWKDADNALFTSIILWENSDGASVSDTSGMPDDVTAEAANGFGEWINLIWSNFPEAVNRYEKLTANVSAQLSQSQSSQITALQSGADTAAREGEYAQALSDCLATLQILPAKWAPQDVEQSLDRKCLSFALHMNPRPGVTSDALRHETYGKTAVAMATDVGGLEQGIDELTMATRFAPWWPDAYYNLAVALEKAGRYSQAAENLKNYLLSDPNAPDTQAVQLKIYSLEYKASHQQD